MKPLTELEYEARTLALRLGLHYVSALAAVEAIAKLEDYAAWRFDHVELNGCTPDTATWTATYEQGEHGVSIEITVPLEHATAATRLRMENGYIPRHGPEIVDGLERNAQAAAATHDVTAQLDAEHQHERETVELSAEDLEQLERTNPPPSSSRDPDDLELQATPEYQAAYARTIAGRQQALNDATRQLGRDLADALHLDDLAAQLALARRALTRRGRGGSNLQGSNSYTDRKSVV